MNKSLFGCEVPLGNHIIASMSVVSIWENEESLPVISYLMVQKLPLQAACCQVVASPASGPLPSPESRSRSSQESGEENLSSGLGY